MPRNEFRQPMQSGGPVRKPYSSSVPSPHRLFKNSSSVDHTFQDFRRHCQKVWLPKKIYRLKEDQAFSLSLELGRRSKVARHPSADFIQSPLQPVAYLFIADNDAPSLLRRGWSGFCRYYYCSENVFKRKVSRDSLSSIFIQFYEVISVHSYVR